MTKQYQSVKWVRAFLFLGVLALAAGYSAAQSVDPNLFSGMRWRMIGPHRGGRALAVSGIPGQPNVYYFGAVAGGVWKTTDAGQIWKPVFDEEPIASIGALAVAPSDPNVIYVGTGEADMRSDISIGDGVYKSSDGGQTWKNIGLRDSRHIGRILVDSRDPNVVLVAALGHAYGPSAERGVFRSTDGGATWQKVLYKDENTGAIDLACDPNNSRIVYAALWRTRRPPWSTYPPMGGPGSGLYKSTDAGITWHQISGHGLPTEGVGRIGVAVAPGENGNRVYALIDAKAGEGGLYRSDDAGQIWSHVGRDSRIWGRGWYFGGVTVDPKNPDIVYVGNVALYRSIDGGKSFTAIKGAPGGDDYHSLWIAPEDSQRMILGSDQGTVISVDGGQTWSSWYNQPTAQFYHVITDNQFPYRVYGAQQDSGTASVTSRSDFGAITFRDWFSVGAGEAGSIAPDPANPDIIFGGDTSGTMFRFDRRTGQTQNISPSPHQGYGSPISQRKYRFTWTSPLVFSPQDPHVLYMGSQYLLKTTDGGTSWQEISPDLTGAEKSAPASSGPLDVSNAKRRGYGVVYAIAPSPVSDGLIWAGTDTGLIQLTRDGGKSWTNVTPPGLSDWSKISVMDASRHDAGTAYAAVDRHRLDDYNPYILRTHDYGKTWTKITNGIMAPAYVHAVREDPERRGLLFAGTETGVYVSFDDGDHWQPLQLNLPVAPVHDLVVHENDLVIATHGRSFWILDDITPLRQIDASVAASDVYLFQPETAIRVRPNVNVDTPLPPETPAGENPPPGAILDYYLKSAAPGEVTLEILDESGNLIRRYSSEDKPETPKTPPAFTSNWIRPAPPLAKSAGMQRFAWDLRYAKPPALFDSYTMAAAFAQGTTNQPEGPLVLPGNYQVKLTVAGHSYTRPVTVQMDPRVTTSRTDLAAQLQLGLKISDLMKKSYETYAEVRDLRGQLDALRKRLADEPRGNPIVTAATELDGKARALEGRGELDGTVAAPESLFGLNDSLGHLAILVDGADRAPTAQAQAAFEEYRGRLNALLEKWEQLKKEDLSALNALIHESKIPPLRIVPGNSQE
jgi:photosystem II stability/assembly factor-like uncharacterized protein